MKKLKILFVKKEYNYPLDGGDIYNKKLIEAMEELGHAIKIYNILATKRKISIPFWKFRISKKTIKEVLSLRKNFDKVIVSHESLGLLAKYVEIDLFIFQNLFSSMQGSSWKYRALYKLGAFNFENKICKKAKSILVLSKREYLYLSQRFDNVHFFPPGVEPIIKVELDFDYLPLERGAGWKLKKRCETPVSLLEKKFIGFIKTTNRKSLGRIALIEDDFKLGFKLKLIQALFSSDIIFSRLDFREELIALGLNADNIYPLQNDNKVHRKNIDKFINYNSLEENRKIIRENYLWSHVANFISLII